MLKSPLGWSFFGFSSDYRKFQLDEFFILSRDLHMSWTDFQKMPTYARRYIVDKLIETYQK